VIDHLYSQGIVAIPNAVDDRIGVCLSPKSARALQDKKSACERGMYRTGLGTAEVVIGRAQEGEISDEHACCRL
jgi:hypothetical protein